MGDFHRFDGSQNFLMGSQASTSVATSPLWGRRIGWLLILGPFFFFSYGFTNHLAAQRAITDTLFFSWERQIPFLPWTILPYWSIDLFYGLSFLLCRNRLQVDRHALRLLTAQLVSVVFFLVFPLHFGFQHPHVDGVFGRMFDALMGFDLPYNQAPSLHISLLVIIWVRFATTLSVYWRAWVHIVAALIGLSVLTTFQHHFIDIPTGALVGFFCLWIWPDNDTPPLSRRFFSPTVQHFRIARYYQLGAFVLAGLALGIGGAALWLWWCAASLSLIVLFYLWTGAAGFQKQGGQHSLAVTLLLAPYLFGAWINSRWWTRNRPAPDEIADNVWLGRMPSVQNMRSGGFSSLCDFTAELPAPQGDWHYAGMNWLDLVVPNAAQLKAAAFQIESSRAYGSVLVCCALGYSRSASAVLAWLLLTRRAADVDAAEAMLRKVRPQIVLGALHRAALVELVSVTGASNE